MAVTPAPLRVNLTCWPGQTFDEQLVLQDSSSPPNPVDITGQSAEMQLRVEVADAAPVATWSSDTGELILGGTDGTITFNVSGAALQALAPDNEPATFFYDIVLTDPSETPPKTRRVVEGVVVTDPAVTRPA